MKNMMACHSAEQRLDKRATRSPAATSLQYADDVFLVLYDGRRVGPFSSHWAACAAMIRRADPTFQSTGGDKESDLAIERAALNEECPDCGKFQCETNH
jgi:hypothetical protein